MTATPAPDECFVSEPLLSYCQKKLEKYTIFRTENSFVRSIADGILPLGDWNGQKVTYTLKRVPIDHIGIQGETNGADLERSWVRRLWRRI